MRARSLAAATLAAATLVLATTATIARADTLWFTGSTPNSLIEVGAANVLRIDGNQLVYNTGGHEGSRDLSQIGRLEIDDDPVLSRAERAFADKQWDQATDGYAKTMRSPLHPWIREWSALRLAQAAGNAGRFEAALDAYVTLVKGHLDVAEKFRPPLPQSGNSTYLQQAEAELQLALNDTALTPPQRAELTKFLFEVQKARGDATAAGATAEKLLKETGQSPTPAAGADLAARRATGEMKLAVATKALDSQDYKKAIDTIDADHTAFVDAKQQAEALYVEARAEDALAKTPDEMKDAAIAYLKIVANFKDAEGSPRVNDALSRAATVMDKLGDPTAAARLRAKE